MSEQFKPILEKHSQKHEGYKVELWTPSSAKLIYETLEAPNWAPWLAASQGSIAGRASIFPDGQLVMMDSDGIPAASLSANRISWNGDPESLPCWDQVAGEPTTYEGTYQRNGNTLVLMSMNVRLDLAGKGLARALIEQIKEVAKILNLEHLIGSFRPNEYGEYKLKKLLELGVQYFPPEYSLYPSLPESGGYNYEYPQTTQFEKYCQMVRPEDGLPIDSWLRNLTRNGMIPLKEDTHAMTVQVDFDNFASLKQTYKPEEWQLVPKSSNSGVEFWECGEVGIWIVNPFKETAYYRESNLWGKISITT